MLKINILRQCLLISTILSPITCSFIQKSKYLFTKSKYLPIYSLGVNIFFSFIFCLTFTTMNFGDSIWIGMFSFLGADTIYKGLEGRLVSHSAIINKQKINQE